MHNGEEGEESGSPDGTTCARDLGVNSCCCGACAFSPPGDRTYLVSVQKLMQFNADFGQEPRDCFNIKMQ